MTAGPIQKIHHINFLVHDLDTAETHYRKMLGLGPAVREPLPARKVLTARFLVGETWLVLIQPTSEEGEPARHLRDHGEGFFLLSFAVDDLDRAIAEATNNGSHFTTAQPRTGLAGWRVIDFDNEDSHGAVIQLAQD